MPLTGRGARSLSFASGPQLELAVERLAVDAQDTRGARLVMSNRLKYAFDVPALELLERDELLGQQAVFDGSIRSIVPNARRQIVDRDAVEACQRHCAL